MTVFRGMSWGDGIVSWGLLNEGCSFRVLERACIWTSLGLCVLVAGKWGEEFTSRIALGKGACHRSDHVMMYIPWIIPETSWSVSCISCRLKRELLQNGSLQIPLRVCYEYFIMNTILLLIKTLNVVNLGWSTSVDSPDRLEAPIRV